MVFYVCEMIKQFLQNKNYPVLLSKCHNYSVPDFIGIKTIFHFLYRAALNN